MKKNKVTFSDKLVNDLKKYSNTIAKNMATQFRDALTETAKLAIEEFYKDYKPESYHRHYYNFKENSFEKYYKNPHNQVYRGGVKLTPNNMEELYKHTNSSSNYVANGGDINYVFNLVYTGHHGNVKMLPNYPNIIHIPPIMKPSPLEIILNKRDEMVRNINNYSVVAINNANKETYSSLII